ncbi:MAG: hypothetical protein IPO43_20175 [Rhodoferax sp.]|nr:hypothetical protein [Rhodoferax sp.]
MKLKSIAAAAVLAVASLGAAADQTITFAAGGELTSTQRLFGPSLVTQVIPL